MASQNRFDFVIVKLSDDGNTKLFLRRIFFVFHPWIDLVEKAVDSLNCGRFPGFLQLKPRIWEFPLVLVGQHLIGDDFTGINIIPKLCVQYEVYTVGRSGAGVTVIS